MPTPAANPLTACGRCSCASNARLCGVLPYSIGTQNGAAPTHDSGIVDRLFVRMLPPQALPFRSIHGDQQRTWEDCALKTRALGTAHSGQSTSEITGGTINVSRETLRAEHHLYDLPVVRSTRKTTLENMGGLRSENEGIGHCS
jgi:hypothetical protein